MCVDDVCENPCARISPRLMVCDCPSIDPDTGFASGISASSRRIRIYSFRRQMRVVLLWFLRGDDKNAIFLSQTFSNIQKPSSRRCRSAFRTYDLKSTQGRPIWRVGLDCAGGKRCNRYGICSNDAQPGGTSNRVPALFFAIIIFIFLVAALITTTESFWKFV